MALVLVLRKMGKYCFRALEKHHFDKLTLQISKNYC